MTDGNEDNDNDEDNGNRYQGNNNEEEDYENIDDTGHDNDIEDDEPGHPLPVLHHASQHVP